MHIFLLYSDLKCSLNYAINMKTSMKMMFFGEFLLTLFFIFWGRNSKKAKHREILHFEKHSSLCNRFGKRTMIEIFYKLSFVTLTELRPSHKTNAIFSFKYYFWAILIIFIHLFFHSHSLTIFILTLFETQMLPSGGSCHKWGRKR